MLFVVHFANNKFAFLLFKYLFWDKLKHKMKSLVMLILDSSGLQASTFCTDDWLGIMK